MGWGGAFWRLKRPRLSLASLDPLSQTGERREFNVIMKEIKWKRKDSHLIGWGPETCKGNSLGQNLEGD